MVTRQPVFNASPRVSIDIPGKEHIENERVKTFTGTGLGALSLSRRSVDGVMSTASPSLEPTFDTTVYLVLDDFGKLGRSYLETDEEKADLETVIQGMIVGEYRKPVRVVAFNTAEFWARDVSEDAAWAVINRAVDSGIRLPDATHTFVAFHLGDQVALRAENALI
jgi:hypothetical protein